MNALPRRPLGATGLAVSTLGFGGAPIGFGADVVDETAVALVRRTFDLGITFFDTAPDYRQSEALIGEAIGGRDGVVLATKVGRRQTWLDGMWQVEQDWSERAIRASIDASLRALRVSRLDLVQLHSPPMAVIAGGRARAALEAARQEGLVSAIGLSADDDVARFALATGGFETLQISYSVLEQEPDSIVADAARRGVAVIAKQPLANGIPALRERPGHPDWARKWDIAQAITWAEAGMDARLNEALRWILNAPGVTTAIVGTSRIEHVEQNVRVAAAMAIGAASVIRVGFIGCGLVAQEYRSRLDYRPDRAQIVAFCDLDAGKAAAMAAGRDARVYTDVREMLERERLDAVFDNLPPFGRADELVLAADRGLAIFTTKPLGLRLETAVASLEAIERNDVISSAGYMFRYAGITAFAQSLLADRELTMFIGHVLGSIPGGWSARLDRSGGQIVEQSTHMFDVARVFGGDVRSVYAGGSRLAMPEVIDYPDSTAVTLAYRTGAVGTILSTTAVPQFIWRCSLVARGVHLDLVYDAGTVTGVVDSRRIDHHDPAGGYQEQIDAFLDALETGDRTRIRSPYRDGVKTLATTLAANRSLEVGRPVPVEF